MYTVFRSNPPAVGFAQLSAAAGGESGSQNFFLVSLTWLTYVWLPIVLLVGLPIPMFASSHPPLSTLIAATFLPGVITRSYFV